MPTVKLTYRLAMDAARDEANRHMRQHGRSRWDESDFNVAMRTLSELWGAPEPTIDAQRPTP